MRERGGGGEEGGRGRGGGGGLRDDDGSREGRESKVLGSLKAADDSLMYFVRIGWLDTLQRQDLNALTHIILRLCSHQMRRERKKKEKK
jgi:hypothetical protein